MVQYEELSAAAKQGIDDFRKKIPNILKNFAVVDYSGNRDMIIRDINNHHVWLSTLLKSFCVASGASWVEAATADEFARSKKYWL